MSSAEGYLTEVADGVHAYVQPDGGWCLNNSGFVRADRGGVVIDTAATQRRATRLVEEITKVSPLPPNIVVNTHHHGDHIFGNQAFHPRATVIAHDNARGEVLQAGLGMTQIWPDVDWGEIRLVPPDVTFADRLTVHDDDRPVELLHIGPAHTNNDVVAWLPEQKVLFCGDIVLATATPFCLMGSISGSLAAIERLRRFDAAVVVPGHGPVSDSGVFDVAEKYLRWVNDLAWQGIATGVEPLDVAKQTDLGPFAELGESERLVGNLHRAYAELRGAAPGSAIDLVRPMTEMVAYSGGKLTCHA